MSAKLKTTEFQDTCPNAAGQAHIYKPRSQCGAGKLSEGCESMVISPESRSTHPPFEPEMELSEFTQAVLSRFRDNPGGEADASPFIYSIIVREPSDFHLHEARFGKEALESGVKLRETQIPAGYIPHQSLYGLTEKPLRRVLDWIVDAGGTELEVKYSDNPTGPIRKQRVRITSAF